MRSLKTIEEKEAIITEYLTGNITYRQLASKHGVSFQLIHLWVTTFEGKLVKKKKKSIQKVELFPSEDEQLSTDIKKLQEELRKAKLHNKLLNAMIDIAEDQLKIDIRKKSGTKR